MYQVHIETTLKNGSFNHYARAYANYQEALNSYVEWLGTYEELLESGDIESFNVAFHKEEKKNVSV